tara:strand:- start:1471 stop:3645 length:2175 start_codon:yes stop_codon:yes gene_type:complete
MATTNKLNVTELDFDQIKNNLKNFLKSQSEFTDYDFEGSGLNILLDILAYNTHYNAINAHYSLNEAFLDSAQIRGNIVARAKQLGYVPRSVLAPRANVSLVVTPGSDQIATAAGILTLPRGTKFQTNVQGETFNYVLKDATDAQLENNKYTFSALQIVEGELRTLKYRVDNDIESQKFQLSDANADTSTLRVRVQQNENSEIFDLYTQFESLKDVDATTKVYYIQENTSGLYEIYFGDGVNGFKPSNDNIVTLDYVTTKGPDSNNATFANNALQDTLSDGTNTFPNTETGGSVLTTTISPSSGGTDRETNESIRFNAPLAFATQGRAVTADDYSTIIKSNFANIKAISTWGGEDNVPVDFGSAYISIKPLSGNLLTAAEKTQILSLLKGKNVVSVVPEIVDLEETLLELDVFLKFNPNLTDRTSAEVQTVVSDIIEDYDFNYLNKFDGVFRHSEILGQIVNSEPSITSANVRPRMFQNISPNISASISFDGSSNSVVDTTNNTIALSTSNLANFADGDEITYIVPTGTPIGNLVDGRKYFVRDKTSTTIKLSETLNGNPINLGARGSASGHQLKATKANNNFTLNFVEPFLNLGESNKFILSSSPFRLSTDPNTDVFFGDVAIAGTSNRQVIVYKVVNGENITVLSDAGTLDINAGQIILKDFVPSTTNNIRVTVVPNTLDLAPVRNQLLKIDTSRLTSVIEVDTVAVSGTSGTIDYTTNSRIK